MIDHNIFTTKEIKHISELARIPTSEKEQQSLASGFNSVIKVIDRLMSIVTEKIEPTHHVTGSENVFRKDNINEKQMLSQDEALMNAKEPYKGYFVVDQVLES